MHKHHAPHPVAVEDFDRPIQIPVRIEGLQHDPTSVEQQRFLLTLPAHFTHVDASWVYDMMKEKDYSDELAGRAADMVARLIAKNTLAEILAERITML